MSVCRVISWVVGKGYLLWPMCSLDKTLLTFALLHFILQGQICLVFWYLLTSYFCIPIPYEEKNIFFLCCSLHRTCQLQLLQHQWLGHRLGLLWCWMVCLETNWNHSVIFEIAPKWYNLDCFVDYEGYSVSSKGILAHNSRYNGHLN